MYASSRTHENLTCLYDGKWHRNGFTCSIMIPLVIAVAVVSAVIVVATTCSLVYKFRFEVKLLTFKYCPCFSFLFRCCRRHHKSTKKRHHAFIMYHHNLRQFVDKKIYKPLSKNGYSICIDYENLLPSGSVTRFIYQAIANSHRIIIVLNQDFLNSYWGRRELDQALLQYLEDTSMQFLVILMQDKATLRNVPRWLKSYLRMNIYMEFGHPLFFRQLIMGMPLDPVLPLPTSGSQIFYGEQPVIQDGDAPDQAPADDGLVVNPHDHVVNSVSENIDDADFDDGNEQHGFSSNASNELQPLV